MEGLKQQNSRINAVQALLALVNAVFLIGGVMLALRALWGPRAPVMLLPALAADVCWAGWMAGFLTACRPAVRRGLRIAPWLLVLPLGGKGIAAGFLQLLNGVIYSWNTLHRGGVHLFDVAIQDGDILAFTLFAAVGVGQLAASMQIRRRVCTGAALAAVLLLPQLLAGGMSVWSCALYLSGLLGIWMSIPGQGPSLQGLRILSLCVLALFVFAFTAPRREMQTMQHLRESIVQQISILRYGREMLPMGQLEQANMLHAGEKTRLTVVTEQEKDLYLRGFVGAEYTQDGWQPLAGAAYAGEHEGILRWLQQNGFDPLTQPAQYLSLCGQSTAAPNRLSISVQSAGRSMLYAPASVQSTAGVRSKPQKDSRLVPCGLFGDKNYQITELSLARPAELTVREEWVEAPKNASQQAYSRAEEVYRSFVYASYTQVPTSMQPVLQEMFWQDFDAENTGVYAALDRVRSVLRENTAYTDAPAWGGQNSLQDFLQGTVPGNDVYYASAAVLALRQKGIPARYIEGYYAPAETVSAGGGSVKLTAKSAHAWPEVYFDGVGWLPVDVTPGCYRDAVTLQQMVALPDAIHKTAALQSDAPGAQELLDKAGNTGAQPLILLQLWRASAMGLGMLALLMIAFLVLVLLLEITRYFVWHKKMCLYAKASPMQRAQLIYKRMRQLLNLWGVRNCLGWQAAKTDAELARKVPGVRPGEFMRASQLMEKFLYGGIPPEPYELHTLEVLVRKLSSPENMDFKRYLRCRYCHLQTKKWLKDT